MRVSSIQSLFERNSVVVTLTIPLVELPSVVADFDLVCVTRKAQKENEWTDDEAMVAEADYRKFLRLIQLHSDVKLLPSEAIDAMWHSHILHLRKYLSDCRRLFGRIIYHTPLDGKPDAASVMRTKQLFLEEFGTIPQTYEPLRASGCCSGGTCCQ